MLFSKNVWLIPCVAFTDWCMKLDLFSPFGLCCLIKENCMVCHLGCRLNAVRPSQTW